MSTAKRLCIFALIFLTGCISYNRLTFQSNDLFQDRKLHKNIDKYDVYIHAEEEVYIMPEPKVDENRMEGKIYPSSPTITGVSGQKIPKDERNDLHIYTKGVKRKELTGDSLGKPQYVRLTSPDVESVQAVTTNEKNIYSVFAISALVFVAFLVLMYLLLVALVTATVAAFAVASGSGDSNSNSNSGDSGSGDSNSDGSDSGGGGTGGGGTGGGGTGGGTGGGGGGSNSGSGGGGGGSDSGCYIATMLYGDYDHPQVKFLRQYRDAHFMTHEKGRRFVQWYYQHSPKWVRLMRPFIWFTFPMRWGFDTVIFFLRK